MSGSGIVPEDPWSDLSNAGEIIAMLNNSYNEASSTGLSQDDTFLTSQRKRLIIDPYYFPKIAKADSSSNYLNGQRGIMPGSLGA